MKNHYRVNLSIIQCLISNLPKIIKIDKFNTNHLVENCASGYELFIHTILHQKFIQLHKKVQNDFIEPVYIFEELKPRIIF